MLEERLAGANMQSGEPGLQLRLAGANMQSGEPGLQLRLIICLAGDLSHPVTFQADQITPELILERRQNKVDWKKRPVCGDMDAIRYTSPSVCWC